MPRSSKVNITDAARKMMKAHNDKLNQETLEMMDDMGSLPLVMQKARIREILTRQCATNCNRNDADPLGDGDQSMIRTVNGRQAARELWATGGDIEGTVVELNFNNSKFYQFYRFCVMGDSPNVCKALKEASADQDELTRMLETRLTSMRLSPLVFTIAAGKNLMPLPNAPPREHAKVVKLLLQYGANPYAKDVVGKTVCHYGAGMMATDWTLELVDMCIEASKSAHLFGKEVEIINAENASWNGKRGIAGGYLVDSKKRIVQIQNADGEGHAELAVSTTKLQLANEADQLSVRPLPPLVDVQDRMGSVCMHEVLMSQREDVAKLLLTKYDASIDIEDADGSSPRSMALNSMGMMASSVSPIIAKIAIAKGREEKKQEKVTCDKCKAPEPTPGAFQECARCKSVRYCSKACQTIAWKEWHKHDCTIVLDPPPPNTALKSNLLSNNKKGKIYKTGGYCQPNNVAVGEKFDIKIQANDSALPMMVYDQTRQCFFNIFPSQHGFDRIFKKVKEERSTLGTKSYFKAFFDKSGNCNIFPNSATLKQW
mmetsp:Transcript_6693/g.9713  ORF Transcript_6693/g.9713 Transcript_6693/m.9713 type:complete len:543 (+) Transcript_6693:55-1683(+)